MSSFSHKVQVVRGFLLFLYRVCHSLHYSMAITSTTAEHQCSAELQTVWLMFLVLACSFFSLKFSGFFFRAVEWMQMAGSAV